ncbi:MAG: hypothetical protein FJX75_05180 [Armatimonadetes bacterium]|nr:hypothetical protein [Armatimonadota bacterium]
METQGPEEAAQDAAAFQRQRLEAQFRATPARALRLPWLAALVGVLGAVRMYVQAHAAAQPTQRPLLFGLVFLGAMLFNGFALLSRSRAGYVIVAVFALLPAFGLFAASVHLAALLVSGQYAGQAPVLVACALSLCQLALTVVLLWHLATSEVRRHVWSRADPGEGTPVAGAE